MCPGICMQTECLLVLDNTPHIMLKPPVSRGAIGLISLAFCLERFNLVADHNQAFLRTLDLPD